MNQPHQLGYVYASKKQTIAIYILCHTQTTLFLSIYPSFLHHEAKKTNIKDFTFRYRSKKQ